MRNRQHPLDTRQHPLDARLQVRPQARVGAASSDGLSNTSIILVALAGVAAAFAYLLLAE